MEKIYEEIKDILVILEYPLIKDMNDEERTNIFLSCNRYFLLSWIICKLDNCFEDLLWNGDKNYSLLEETLFELGFCSRDEVSVFVRGMLEPLKELKVIHSLLKYVKKMISLPPGDDCNVPTLHDLEKLEKKDLNLFPVFGDIKVLEDIKEKPNKPQEGDISALLTEHSTSISPEDIMDSIKGIAEDMPKIKRLPESMQELMPPPNFDTQMVWKCSENMKIIYQYIDDVKVVKNFLEVSAENKDLDESSICEVKSMLEALCLKVSSSLDDEL